jgi:hypothetical protein
MSFLERLYGILFQPVKTIREIIRKKPIWQSILVLILTGLLPAITAKIIYPKDLYGNGMNIFSSSQFYSIFMTMAIVSSIFLRPVMLFVSTSVYHLIAEFMGFKAQIKDGEKTFIEDGSNSDNQNDETAIGTGKGLYSALAFATLPTIFMVIINLIFRFTTVHYVWIFNLIFTIWVIVLDIISIRENYKMNNGNAALTFFLPFIVLIVILILMMIFMGVVMAPAINEIMRNIHSMPIPY